MTPMTVVFAWAGVVCVLLILCGFVSLCAAYATDKLTRLYNRLISNAVDLTRREVGTRLIQESYWYNEDEAVMSAIAIIGRKLSQNGYYNVDDARKEWRERKDKPK